MGPKMTAVNLSPQQPFVWREDPHNPDAYTGFVKDVMDEIAQKAGFTYEFNITDDHKFGIHDGFKGWTGVMGDVVNNVREPERRYSAHGCLIWTQIGSDWP